VRLDPQVYRVTAGPMGYGKRPSPDSPSTTHEIRAVGGHKSLREVARYTEAVDQSRLARAAMERLPSERIDDTSV